MKEFIKSSLIEFAVIVLVLSLFDGIEINKWRNFIIFGEILVVVMIFRMCSIFIDKFQNRFYIIDVLVEFIASLSVVLFFGFIFGWYEIDRIGYMVVVGVIVYGICYILGIAGNKKSADYINSQLEKRRKNRENIDKNSADR